MSLSAPHLTQTRVCSPATLCASGISGCTRRGCGAGPASQIEAFIQLGGGSGGSMSGHTAGDIPLVPCATTVGTRGMDHGTACAPRPRRHPRAARTPCPELLLPKLQIRGKMEVEIRGTPKSFTQNTLRDFFLKKFSQKFSFKRSKSCKCPVSWNLMVQETEFTPFGHPPSLPFACSLDMRQHDKIF